MIKKIVYLGKCIGAVDLENKIFVTKRSAEHFFIKYENGLGLSVKVIDFLLDQNIEKVIIRFDNYEDIWVYVVDFISKANPYTHTEDGKIDEQLILPLKFWKKVNERREIMQQLLSFAEVPQT